MSGSRSRRDPQPVLDRGDRAVGRRARLRRHVALGIFGAACRPSPDRPSARRGRAGSASATRRRPAPRPARGCASAKSKARSGWPAATAADDLARIGRAGLVGQREVERALGQRRIAGAAEQAVELDLDQRVALVAGHRPQPVPGRGVGIVARRRRAWSCAAAPRSTDGSLAAKRRSASATTAGSPSPPSAAISSSRRTASLARSPARGAQPSRRSAGAELGRGIARDHRLVRGIAVIHAVDLGRASPRSGSHSRSLALAGAASAMSSAAEARLVAGKAERPIVGEQADLVDRRAAARNSAVSRASKGAL